MYLGNTSTEKHYSNPSSSLLTLRLSISFNRNGGEAQTLWYRSYQGIPAWVYDLHPPQTGRNQRETKGRNKTLRRRKSDISNSQMDSFVGAGYLGQSAPRQCVKERAKWFQVRTKRHFSRGV